MADYTRLKEGFRFKFMGMKLNSSPDSLPPDKYALAINVRAYSDHSVRTRPGLSQSFQGGFTDQYFTDLRAYSALLTDNLPRILGRTATDAIYLDNSVKVGALTGGALSGTTGAAMIPFRPNASPVPYMYIANGLDYQKFSAPDASNNVRQFKVGMPEPQQAPEASCIPAFTGSIGVSQGPGAYTRGGTMGVFANGVRVSDTIGQVFQDPAPQGGPVSVQVSSAAQYQRRMSLTFSTFPGFFAVVADVFAPLTLTYQIAGIFYFSGTTGRCIVVPLNIASDAGSGDSIYSENLLIALRRGALIKIGAEICYVWSVISGPSGSICIETSTVAAHTSADLITGVPAISIGSPPIPGGTITEASVIGSLTAGIGTMTSAPFASSIFATMQPDDYISFGIKVDNLANLNEMKILFDVGDGTFTKDFYYYTVRPSDIAAAVANNSTQISIAQTISQRAVIDEENAAASGNQQKTFSSAQTTAGNNAWSQIVISIRDLTRVGSDASKNLQTLTKLQFLWNASGAINFQVDQTAVVLWGGSQADVGDVGAPYMYRCRPRSTITGVKGNPSPATRYGVSPRREVVGVKPPTIPVTDNQMDTMDIFRYGGTVTSWRWIGAITDFSVGSTFSDTFSDEVAGAGEELEFDNLEPWPSVGLPSIGLTSVLTGTMAVISSTDTNTPNYLPGTLVQLQQGSPNQTAFTLRTRPIHLTGNNYLLEFIENAGFAPSPVIYTIQEPLIANAKLPFMWGSDVNGTIFAVGDPLNPGKLYFAKGNTPDSAPAPFNIEITPPSEPLLGGEVLDGLSFVASTERWWALYPQPDNPLQRYNFVQQPIERGIAAPYGHCNDGKEIFYWAKDGIRGTSRGSLTDDDLYNLFPHEGVKGQNVIYNGVTIPTPDYAQAGKFRLAHSNGYLYALYNDVNGTYQCLVLDLRRMAWSFDIYPTQPTAIYKVEQQVESSTALNPVLLIGLMQSAILLQGVVCTQIDLTDDRTVPIPCTLATREFDGGDIRAGEQWGDVYLDSLPASGIAVTPVGNGAPISTLQNIPVSSVRVAQPVSLGGQVLSNFLGLFLQWTDDFTVQASPTTLYIWQPSFIPKPESITDRVEDWEDGGIAGAKWFQGFVMHADTSNVAKGMTVRDSDSLAVHAFTPIVQHNGESEKAYSFNQPFIAHQVRLEPTDIIPWRLFDVRWIAEPTPEFAETWTTQPSTHGLKGFMHLRQASITYSATAPVILTVGVFDGTAPASITLPSTGGVVQKIVVPFTFNKGQLYTYSFSSGTPFQIYQSQCEVLVGQWGREDTYINRPLAGSTGGDEAKI